MSQIDNASVESIEVDQLALAIPARRFKIKATLAYDQSFSLVDEFVLRFLRLCGDVSTDKLREFFGFSQRELFVTLLDLGERGLIKTNNDVVQLGARARAAFKDLGDEEPRIVAVEETDMNIAFEQIASTPLEKTPYRKGSLTGIMDLRSEDREQAARPSEEAIQAFKLHFSEISEAYLPQRQDLKRAYVYSVDEVTPKKPFRHELVLPVVLRTGGRPEASIDYSKLLNSRPRGSRNRLIARVSELIQTLESPQSTTREGFGFISEFDAGFITQIFSGNEPCQNGLLPWLTRVTLSEQQDYASDTLEFVGSLSMSKAYESLANFTSIIDSESNEANKSVFWLKPNLPLWGRSTAFRERLDRLAGIWGKSATRVLLVPSDDVTTTRDLKRAFQGTKEMPYGFDVALKLLGDTFPDTVEFIYRPGCWVAVAVYLAVTDNAPLVPVGFFSKNLEVLRSTDKALKRRLLPLTSQAQYIWTLGLFDKLQMNELFSRMLSSVFEIDLNGNEPVDSSGSILGI